MKNSLRSLLAGAALVTASLIGAGAAQAAVIPFTDVITGPVTVTKNSPYSFTHNINDSINTATDTITDLHLSLVLQDTGGNEKVYVAFEGAPSSLIGTNVPNAGQTFTFDNIVLNLIAALQADGLLQMTLSVLPCTCGASADVTFASSTLTGTADRAEVPEPGILTLLGAGLAGLGLVRRRRSGAQAAAA